MLALIASLAALALAPLAEAALGRWPRVAEGVNAAASVLVAALVLLDALPHAVEVAGLPAVLAAGLGLLVPVGCGWLPRGELGVLAVATAALAVHGLIDGAVLATAPAEGGGALVDAIVLHSLPVGLAVWRATREDHGVWLAGAVLATAGLAQVAGYAGGPAFHAAELPLALAQALVAGSLLHLVGHHHGPEDRAATGFGAVVGASLALVLLHGHAGVAPARGELAGASVALGLAAEAAPALVAGVLGAAWLRVRGAASGWWACTLAGRAPGLPALAVGLALLGPWSTLLWALALPGAVAPAGAPSPAQPSGRALTGLLAEVAPWAVVGLLLASWVEPLAPGDALVALAAPAQWALALGLGWVAAPAGVGLLPLLAVLGHKGMLPGAVLAALVVASARMGAPAGSGLRRGLPTALVLAVGVDRLLPVLPSPGLHELVGEGHGPVQLAALGLALAGVTTTRVLGGLGGFVTTLDEASRPLAHRRGRAEC